MASGSGQRATVAALLEKPFGPYLEEEVLVPSCRGTTKDNPVALRNFLLICKGVTTGLVPSAISASSDPTADLSSCSLSECEKTQPGYKPEIFADNPIQFTGVLEIQQLSWLTDVAIEAIEDEMKERDVRARSEHGTRAGASNLTLKRIYAPAPGISGAQLRVKIILQGVKQLPAVYLNARHVPDALMIVSKAHGRRYMVESMHPHTHQLSQAYIQRFRLVQVLQNLLKLDGDCNSHDDNPTPLERRTPAWFVDLYLKHMAQAGAQRRERPVHDSADSDVEVGGRMRGKREHILRHVSRTDVYALFATHAEWVVGQVAGLRFKRWLDLESWGAWLQQLRQARRAAAQAGYTWGVYEGVDAARGTEDDLPAQLRARMAQKAKKTKQKRAPRQGASRGSGTTSSTTLSAEPPSHGPSRMRTPSPYVDDTMLRTYDLDFSPESTPPGSPSSASSGGLPSRAPSPVDPRLAALIPASYLQPPQPTATYKWACPEDGCAFMIDLLNLTDADLDPAGDSISADERRRLKSKQWNVHEEWAREAFGYMVGVHQKRHLEERGVTVEMHGKEVGDLLGARWRWLTAFLQFHVRWNHPPGTLPQSDQLRKVKKDNRRPVIKLEDN
ncbi:hypothetical protein C2E23DRAFT_932451 [Lenzites betulinus]|nr:hypothetical protein C2E23DRAFT_932451 [Lenzites betulinus]